MSLRSQLCFNTAEGALSTEKLDPGIKNPRTLFTGISDFFITDRGVAQGVYYFFFLVSNCFALLTGAD